MKLRNALLLAPLAAFFVGCGPKADLRYQSPTQTVFQNTAIVNSPFEDTWDRLIKNLSREFFVINNVEKVSRIINVSFYTDTPGDLIDCGMTTRTYQSGGGSPETFTYVTANSSTYKTADPTTLAAYAVVRTTKLEGRANIYVAPIQEDTELSTNVRYIWTVTANSQQLNWVYGSPMGGIFSDSRDYTFDSNKPLHYQPPDGPMFDCYSKGVLEQRIIDAAKPT